MNVTVKIDDHLCREARHRAVDRGLSLSGWIAEVLSKELATNKPAETSLLNALAIDDGAEKPFEIQRDRSPVRDLPFAD